MLAVTIAIFSVSLKFCGFIYTLAFDNYPSIGVEISDGVFKIGWEYTDTDGRSLIISPHSLKVLSEMEQKSKKHLAVVLNEIGSGHSKTVSYFSNLMTVNNQGKKTIVWETGHDRTGAIMLMTMLLLTALLALMLSLSFINRYA